MDLKSCRLLVTPTSFGKSDLRLKTDLEAWVGKVIYNTTGRPLAAEELCRLLPGVDGFIAGLDAVNREAIEAADRLKVIARYGVGVDNVDLVAARQHGIAVTNTPGANAPAVAELAVGLFLSLARRIPWVTGETRAGQWPRIQGVSLEGKTIGLLGFGAVGKCVAERLQGFHARVIAYDPIPDEARARQLGVTLLTQEEVVRKADFLSLHLPLLPETNSMVNRAFLDEMKPGSFLVNTARGELLDENAVLEALRSGHLRGLALDVFPQEPPDPGNPLLALPQVILTPHIGSHTDGATNAMGWMAVRDCLAVLRGEEPLYPVSQP